MGHLGRSSAAERSQRRGRSTSQGQMLVSVELSSAPVASDEPTDCCARSGNAGGRIRSPRTATAVMPARHALQRLAAVRSAAAGPAARPPRLLAQDLPARRRPARAASAGAEHRPQVTPAEAPAPRGRARGSGPPTARSRRDRAATSPTVAPTTTPTGPDRAPAGASAFWRRAAVEHGAGHAPSVRGRWRAAPARPRGFEVSARTKTPAAGGAGRRRAPGASAPKPEVRRHA